jgi:hypothetical protein
VSVTFYGVTVDHEPIALDIEDPAFLNMASANARAFLAFLGIEPGADPSGGTSLPEARRAAMLADDRGEALGKQVLGSPQPTRRRGKS